MSTTHHLVSHSCVENRTRTTWCYLSKISCTQVVERSWLCIGKAVTKAYVFHLFAFLNCSVTIINFRVEKVCIGLFNNWKYILSAPWTDSFWEPAKGIALFLFSVVMCMCFCKYFSQQPSRSVQSFVSSLFKQAACQRATLTYLCLCTCRTWHNSLAAKWKTLAAHRPPRIVWWED